MSHDGRSRVVRLENVPTRLFLESQDHQHDLIRELKLVHLGRRFDLVTCDISGELADLIAAILAQYGDVRAATREQAIAALDRGEPSVTLEVPVRPGIERALQEWLRHLEAADRLCSGGELLLLAARDEVRELRRWYVEQLLSRLRS